MQDYREAWFSVLMALVIWGVILFWAVAGALWLFKRINAREKRSKIGTRGYDPGPQLVVSAPGGEAMMRGVILAAALGFGVPIVVIVAVFVAAESCATPSESSSSDSTSLSIVAPSGVKAR